MIKSLCLNKLIYNQLKNITDLGERLYPIIAENGTKFPFAIYKREGVVSSLCKDGVYEDEVSFSVKIVTAAYHQGVDLAQRVRECLQVNRISDNDITMTNIRLTSAFETYEFDSYVQTLNFQAIVY